MKYIPTVLLIVLASCASNFSQTLNAFAEAKTPESELKQALQLNSLHLQITVQFFDANHKRVQTDVAYKTPDKVVFVEVQLKAEKIERRILNKNSIHALLQE
jgi:flagellar basal body-associated protein FliL